MIGWKRATLAASIVAIALLSARTSLACPFCTATSLTFCEEIRASDVSIIARLVKRPAPQEAISADAEDEIVKAKFEVVEVLTGAKHLGKRKTIETTYFGRAKVGAKFLLMGIDPPTVFWSTPIEVTDRAVGYLRSAIKLPTDGSARLTFFLNHLEDKDEMLARDAYDEFAKAPYDVVKSIKGKMDHDKLIGWIKDVEVPASRRRLYLTMLGVCGTEKDIPLLEDIITSGDRQARAGFDALIGCYLTLKGEAGLKLIEDRFLRSDTLEEFNPKTGKIEQRKVEYSDTYAAIQALRFHGQQGGVLSKQRVVASMRLMLARTKLADLVIPDLARWGDWKSLPTLVKLFKEADPESTWVRTPVLLYLMACPLPEAKKHLAVLAKLDPDAYERANAFAPLVPAKEANVAEGAAPPKETSGDASVQPAPSSSKGAAGPVDSEPVDAKPIDSKNGDDNAGTAASGQNEKNDQEQQPDKDEQKQPKSFPLTLTGHQLSILSASFSPDGKRVVTGSRDYTARIWDSETGKELKVLIGHTGFVISASFSPDGKQVVTAGKGSTARIWDAETGKELKVLKGHTSGVYSASFSPDGKQVVTASLDHTARIWDAETGKQLKVLKGHRSGPFSTSFSPDGKRVLTGRGDRTARIWDVKTGKELKVLTGHTDEVTSLSFSPDGKQVVTGSRDRTAGIWDVETGKELKVLRGHTDRVYSASFSPDGKRVVTAGGVDKTARIWDAESGKELQVLRGHERYVRSASFSPDGKQVVTASGDRTARIWDAETGKELKVLRQKAWVRSTSFFPDGKRVLIGGLDNTARIWPLFEGYEKPIVEIALDPKGKLFALRDQEGNVRVWEIEDSRKPRQLSFPKPQSGPAASIEFTEDSKTLIGRNKEGEEVLRWNLPRSEVRAKMNRRNFLRTGGAAALGGTAAAGQNEKNDQEQQPKAFHFASVSFSPDGKRVVTAGYDKTARIWDSETGKELKVLKGHMREVISASFSPDGKRVVTGSYDKTVRIWDAETGKELKVLRGHGRPVTSASFSPDGKRVVTAGGLHRPTRIWDAKTGKELKVYSTPAPKRGLRLR